MSIFYTTRQLIYKELAKEWGIQTDARLKEFKVESLDKEQEYKNIKVSEFTGSFVETYPNFKEGTVVSALNKIVRDSKGLISRPIWGYIKLEPKTLDRSKQTSTYRGVRNNVTDSLKGLKKTIIQSVKDEGGEVIGDTVIIDGDASKHLEDYYTQQIRLTNEMLINAHREEKRNGR